jgi:CHAD domain-containing protein
MFQSATPIAFFQQQINILQSQMPGLLDGRLDSIHDARIATRRIREVLPLTHEWQRRHAADELFDRIRRAGKSLGKVRDSDVRIGLLRYLESRIPHAAPSLVLVRQRQERQRLVLMRKLVKRFERLGIGEELVRLSTGSAWQRSRFWVKRAGGWRQQLHHLIAERAHAASEAVVHATGVYFPNRAHAARIAIKKLRYAAEIGAHTGLLPNDDALVRPLKKTQDLLGEMHDRQALIDELTGHVDGASEVDAGQIALVARVAEAEIDDLHARVLARRARVMEACCAAQRTVHRAHLPVRTLAAAGAVALTSFEARRRRKQALRDAARLQSAREVSIRIPVSIAADECR